MAEEAENLLRLLAEVVIRIGLGNLLQPGPVFQGDGGSAAGIGLQDRHLAEVLAFLQDDQLLPVINDLNRTGNDPVKSISRLPLIEDHITFVEQFFLHMSLHLPVIMNERLAVL